MDIETVNNLRLRWIEIDQEIAQLTAIPLVNRPLDKIKRLADEAVQIERRIAELRPDLYR